MLNPFFLIFLKVSLIIGLVRMNDLMHHPVACAVIYTLVVGFVHFMYSAGMNMPMWQIGAFAVGGLIWGVFYFRLLNKVEASSDHLVYSVFGGFLLLAI